MSDTIDYFARIRGQINVPLLAAKHVVVVGVGTVGSPVAEHPAKDGVGSFLFIDGDTYEEENRVRHPLPAAYTDMNKAEAMSQYLRSERIPSLQVDALARFVDDTMSDRELDELLESADLIVAGTGETAVQRRLGSRALALDIPAIFPALFRDGGGEVFLQTSPNSPCFFCHDGWRRQGEPVRGAEALEVEATRVIQTAIELCLGVLDSDSRYEELTLADDSAADPRPRQLFLIGPEGVRTAHTVEWRRNCPSCNVGPSQLRPDAATTWVTATAVRNRALVPRRSGPGNIPVRSSTQRTTPVAPFSWPFDAWRPAETPSQRSQRPRSPLLDAALVVGTLVGRVIVAVGGFLLVLASPLIILNIFVWSLYLILKLLL